MLTRTRSGLVGLDFGADSVAAVAVTSNGSPKVERTAIAPLEPGLVNEGDVVDVAGLASAVRRLFDENRLSKNVRLGVANQRVTMRTIRLPLIEDDGELDTAIRFKAQDAIPMPLENAVLDYQVVGRGKGEAGERWMDVAAVAGRRDMLLTAVETLREAGLRPVGIDLSAFGMLRALAPSSDGEDAAAPATLYCHFGDVTNLAVARGASCLFTRVAAFGYEDIVGRLAERCAIPVGDARAVLREARFKPAPVQPASPASDQPSEWIADPGRRPRSEEGEPGESEERRIAGELLGEGAAKLADEIRHSLEAYGAQEGAAAVDRLVLCGPGSTVLGLEERLEQSLGYAVESRFPAALASLPDAEAARALVPYGLALEE